MKKLIVTLVFMCSLLTAFAKYEQVDSIVLPKNTPIHKIVVDDKEKYVICIGNDEESLDVYVSKYNINKQLVLIKWQNEKGNIQYPTKAYTPNMNLKTIKIK